MKQVGKFISEEFVSPTKMYLRAKEYLNNTNLHEFVESCEDGISNYDDLDVAYFEYGDGGTGSVIVFLAIYLDDFGDFFNIEYAIQKELRGVTEVVAYVPFRKEVELYEKLFEVLQEQDLAFEKELAS